MISLNQNFTPKFNVSFFILFYFFCTSNFLALILQSETVKLNVIKSKFLVDVVEVLVLVQPAFLFGEVVNLILWTFYINHEL